MMNDVTKITDSYGLMVSNGTACELLDTGDIDQVKHSLDIYSTILIDNMTLTIIPLANIDINRLYNDSKYSREIFSAFQDNN